MRRCLASTNACTTRSQHKHTQLPRTWRSTLNTPG